VPGAKGRGRGRGRARPETPPKFKAAPAKVAPPAAFYVNYYEALGLTDFASEAQIKAAFRELALKHHPDKGGDAEQFKLISAAHQTLMDQAARFTWHVTPPTNSPTTRLLDVGQQCFRNVPRPGIWLTAPGSLNHTLGCLLTCPGIEARPWLAAQGHGRGVRGHGKLSFGFLPQGRQAKEGP